MDVRVKVMISVEMERDIPAGLIWLLGVDRLIKSDLEGEGWRVLDITVLTTGIGQAKMPDSIEGF